MNRKSVIPILSLVLITMSGCGKSSDSSANPSSDSSSYHTHTYDTSTWKYNDTQHWHPTTCGHDSELKDDHVFIDDGEKKVCAVCGYTASSDKEAAFQTWKTGVLATLDYDGAYTSGLDFTFDYTLKKSNGTNKQNVTKKIKETVSDEELYACSYDFMEKSANEYYGAIDVFSIKKYDDNNYIYSSNGSTSSSSDYSKIGDIEYLQSIKEYYVKLPVAVYGYNKFIAYAENYIDCPSVIQNISLYFNDYAITDSNVNISQVDDSITLTSEISMLDINSYSSDEYTKGTITDSVTVQDGKVIKQEIFVRATDVESDRIYNIDFSYKHTYKYEFDNDLYTSCNEQVIDKITDDSYKAHVNLYFGDNIVGSSISNFNEAINQSFLDSFSNYNGNAVEYYLDKDLTIKYESQPLTKSLTNLYMKTIPVEDKVVFNETYITQTNYPDYIPQYLKYDPKTNLYASSYDSSDSAVEYLNKQVNKSNSYDNYTVMVDGKEFSSDMTFETGKVYDITITKTSRLYDSKQLKSPSYYEEDDDD